MNLPNDFENRELSIEELDMVAAGGWFSSIVHGVDHFFHNPTVLKVLAVGASIAGAFFGSWANNKLNPPPQN